MAEADRQDLLSAQPESEMTNPRKSERRKMARGQALLMLVVPAIIILAGLWYWFGNQGEVATDNAYLKLDMVSVSGEVSGKIVTVMVKENQLVRKGDVLFELDTTDYQVALAQADAEIASAQARIISARAEINASAAQLAGARDDLALAEANYRREKELMDRGFNTHARMDAATHAVASAKDRLTALEADLAKSQAELATGAQVPGIDPAIAAARASRERAKVDLQRTVVRAPATGWVTQVERLQVGQAVVPGVPMLSIVRDDDARVEANFKETDLNHMRPGQKAEITIDAYPGLKLTGHVDSIGAGTGSEFSLLPAQNATGNWVKITQRVPVRIAIDSKASRPLISGLSTKVTVFTKNE